MNPGLNNLTPLKAIKAQCVECSGSRWAVWNCGEKKCPLFAFRTGHNPRRKGIGRPGGNPGLKR